MKKFLSLVFAFVLVAGLLSLPAASAATIASEKITDELSAAITENGSAKAFVTMNDVDHARVMKTFMTEYPAEFEAYMMAKFDVQPTSGNEITDALAQSALERKREIYREYYTAANQAVMEACVEDEDVLFVSAYSPMAIVEITRAEALELAQNGNVVQLEAVPEGNILSDSTYYNGTTYTFEDAVETLETANAFSRIDEVRDTYGLTGSGVNIGMIETGVPKTSNPFLQGTTIYKRSGYDTESDHATAVAIIIAGQDATTDYGAAPDAALYCTAASSHADFYSGVEWLINQGVNVINMSTSFYKDGTYDICSQWIDHIAVMHDVHVVSAAGNTYKNINTEQIVYKVHDTAMAYNAIAVGGYNMLAPSIASLSLAAGSCYEEAAVTSNGPRAEKPNLVANFFYNRPPDTTTMPENSGIYGTSFAAPQVTGVVAQLCSYNWELKFKQTAMGAILMASAAKKIDAVGLGEKGDTFATSVRVEGNEQVSNKEGAGVLDAYWARGIVIRGNYWSPTVYSTGFPYTKEVTIDATANTVSRVAIFWLARNSVSDHTSGTATTPVANLDLYIYDPDGECIGYSELTYANFEIVQFTPTVTGTYTIQIEGSSTEKEYIGIALW